ncbi:MAG: ketoacyl-ACP synthase III, partial [Granulicella sp.]
MAFLRSFGSYLPERIVTNAELATGLGVEPDWILSVSGIADRRYAAADDTVASLGTRAAINCLEQAGLQASDLGMILVSSGSSERFCPGPASLIAASLGLTMTPAIDIPM